MEQLIEFVGGVGFPIVACFYLVRNNEKLIDSFSELSLTLKGIDSRLENIEKERDKYYD